MRRRREQHHPLDHAAKEIFRLAPDLVARLLGITAVVQPMRFADTSVRSREHRADKVMLFGDDGETGAFGWHLEYQAGDDPRELLPWVQKNAAMNVQLKRPISLVVVYLQRCAASNSLEISAGGITNRHEFVAIRLWEFEDRIRNGEFPELAPFLILWNHDRGEPALSEQRDLLLNAPLPHAVIEELLGWSVVVGSRFFPNEVLRRIFDKELEMLKDFPEVQRWIEEGREEGVLQTARRFCKDTLRARFGLLSPASEEYLEMRTADELHDLAVRALSVPDLRSLDVPT